MKVLMISLGFPKGHRREGQLTGFVPKILDGTKLHTIRKNEKKHFVARDLVSLRHWTGRPYRSKQQEFATERIVSIEPVRIVYGSDGISAFVDGHRIDAADLVVNDGLNAPDFISWFFPDGRFGNFHGDILHFTDLRYGG